jgi:hypothetical protein
MLTNKASVGYSIDNATKSALLDRDWIDNSLEIAK